VRKEGAKSLTEEEVTGALIRALKSGERNVCFTNGAGEHSIDDRTAGLLVPQGTAGARQLQERAVTLKPAGAGRRQADAAMAIGQAAPAGPVEVPKDCTVLVVGGPQAAYPAPVADAIKSYVEDGGRAIIMLDNVIRIGRSEAAAPNDDLEKLLERLGRHRQQRPGARRQRHGADLRLRPGNPGDLQYESHPITQPLTRVPRRFRWRARWISRAGGKASRSTSWWQTTEDSLAVTEIGPGGTVDPKKGKKGPFTLMAAGTYRRQAKGRFVVVGPRMGHEQPSSARASSATATCS
jgi:hypothetical protein